MSPLEETGYMVYLNSVLFYNFFMVLKLFKLKKVLKEEGNFPFLYLESKKLEED